MCESIMSGVIGLIAGLIIGFFTAKLRHNLELDRVYLAPFRKWCAQFYDELYEFKKRYLDVKAQSTSYSDIQVIDDWRALHDISAYAMGWLAKIRKEEGQWVLQFEELLRSIDEFWHKLESEEQFVLQNRSDIIGLGVVKQDRIANALRNEGVYLLQTEEHKKIIDHVLTKYLPKKVPSENIFKRLWKRIKRRKEVIEMAVKAYVLIETEVGKTGTVAQGLQKVQGVKSADPVTGSYDVVAAIEVADLDAVAAVVKKLHSVPGICKTTTLIAVKY